MIKKGIKKNLIKAIGKGKVFDEKEYLITYSYDATRIEYLPDLVVFPENKEDIERILKISYKYKIPVTPRGAGVGYSGGALPYNRGIVIVFTKMNRILNIDTKNFIAEVEPGVVTYELQNECEKKELFYPPDPASLKTSTIGGNISENSGGPRCFKYGVTSNYVLELECFLVNGDKVKFGSNVIKDVAGYDLKSLIIGSEGTLAVISKIVLRLIPLPEFRVLFRVDFKSLKIGAEFINRVISSKIYPSVLEFMDRNSISASSEYMGVSLNNDINASVLIEIDGNEIEVKERKNRFIEVLKGCEILNYKIAETEEEQEELWEIRRNISPAISSLSPKKINEDIVVPVSKIPETVEFVDKLAKEYNLLIILFGHFGDGNIHTNLMVDPDNPEEMRKSEIVLNEIFRYVISKKGSITGEHGVGISKKPFMKYQFSNREIELFKQVKRVFDPENLLNPGKIF